MDMSERLRKVRLQAGMTQGKFAESIGMSQANFSRVEKGEQLIPSDALAEVLRHYRVHPNWLFFGEGGDGPVYLEELVARREYEREREEKLALAEENRQLYKRLYDQEKERSDRLKAS